MLHLRMPDETKYLHRFGIFTLDTRQRVLLRDGRPVRLAPRTFEILEILVESSNQVVDRKQLMDKVWQDTFVEEANLSVHISQLRKILRTDDGLVAIETYPKTGYRLVAEVATSNGHPDLDGASKRRRYIAVGGVVLLAVVLVAGLSFSWQSAELTVHSIAVLPFTSDVEDIETESLADGLTEGLIRRFSQIPGLAVKARSSVMIYKGKSINRRDAGRDLSAQYLLLGQLSLKDHFFHIRLELVKAESGDLVWSDSFVHDEGDLQSLQNEIVGRVLTKIRPSTTTVDHARLLAKETTENDAYKEYLRGRYFLNRRSNRDFLTAILHFQRAIQLDPDYSLAYSGLADSYYLLAVWGGARENDVLPQARASALRALELNPDLAEAHATYANLLPSNHPDVERLYKRAIELNHGYASAHQWYAEFLCNLGRFDEARAEIRRAIELDPLSRILRNIDGRISLFAGRPDEAIEIFNRNIVLDPTWGGDHDWLFHAYAEKRMYSEAVEAHIVGFTLLNELKPTEARALRAAFEEAGWRGFLLERLKQFQDPSRPVPAKTFSVMELYARLGETEKALALLNSMIESKSLNLGYLRYLPSLAPMRDDDRFDDMLRRAEALQ